MIDGEVILITGSNGMVGKSLVRMLKKDQFKLLTPNSSELDLKNQYLVEEYFSKNKIDYVFHLAAKVGGISANINYPGQFIYENLMINSNVIEAARRNKIKKLLFLGSSCIYPKNCGQPMGEESLLSGKLEPTNEGYALSKISGLKTCEFYNKQYGTNFISLMPCNLYGPNDHFEPLNSHVISALILRLHKAKLNKEPNIEIWGSGNARREFLFVDDLAKAMVYFMKKIDAKEVSPFINIGYGKDISIKDLSYKLKSIVGYQGELVFNSDKPEGMMKKLLNISKANENGWKPETDLDLGLKLTYEWFLKNKVNVGKIEKYNKQNKNG